MATNSTPNIHNIVICSNLFVRKDGKYLVIKRSPHKAHLPNMVHPIGGKVDANEDPLLAAKRELFEEAGIEAKNVKLEAVVTEVPHPEDPQYKQSWLIFHFSGDYDKGNLTQTDEGELIWKTPEELQASEMFSSVKLLIESMINPDQGPVFARFVYDKERNIVEKQISIA